MTPGSTSSRTCWRWAMSSGARSVTVGDVTVTYDVRVSEQATQPRIDVGIHGVTVVLPTESTEDPDALIIDNVEWILDKQTTYEEYLNAAPDRVFEEGESFPYLGEDYELVVEQRSASQMEDGSIRLAKHHVKQTSIKQALRQFYRRKAREVIEDKIDHYADEMGVTYDRLEIRNQRTKWGSCSSSGTLGINWRLIMAPEEIIDYVIVHELAHLEEANHTKQFWSVVATYDSEYEEHAEWLEANSTQLIFSEDDL